MGMEDCGRGGRGSRDFRLGGKLNQTNTIHTEPNQTRSDQTKPHALFEEHIQMAAADETYATDERGKMIDLSLR